MGNKIEKILYILGISALLIGGLFFYQKNNSKNVLAGVSNLPVDLFGTRVGTTTTGVGIFGVNVATSSKAVALPADMDTAIITIKPVLASTTARVTWDIFGSNDSQCDTATTTINKNATYNQALAHEINWFNADPTNTRVTGQASFTSTNATGTIVTLTNLTWQCLKIDLHGASTSPWVQLRTKSLTR